MKILLDGTFEKPFYRYLHITKMDLDDVYTNIMHTHFCLELIFVFQGRGYMQTEKKKISIKKGDLILVRRGSVHTEYSSDEERLCFYSLQLGGISFEQTEGENGFYLIDFLSAESKDKIERIFQLVHDEEKEKSASYLNMITFLVDSFLLVLARENVSLLATDDKSSIYIKKADDYIKEHIFDKITLDDLAQALCLNKYSLIKKFKAECGVTPARYIMEQKMRKACELISFSDYTIEEISDQLGFCSVSHFYQVYKRVTGSLPTKLRNKN